MANRKPASNSLADPTTLKPIDKNDGILQVIIETPKGARTNTASTPTRRSSLSKRSFPPAWCFLMTSAFSPAQ